MSALDEQREITRVVLATAAGAGFALAGAGAVREHGLTNRPTEDVDLFTSVVNADAFRGAVASVMGALRDAGYEVELAVSGEMFARLTVKTADGRVDVDMGVDWRREPPVTLEVGPVLSLTDAVAAKVLAVYGRMEARDYLDLDAIRGSGVATDAQLLAAALERDPGFDERVFAGLLADARTLGAEEVVRYGVTAEALVGVIERLSQWSLEILGRESPAAKHLALECPGSAGPDVDGPS